MKELQCQLYWSLKIKKDQNLDSWQLSVVPITYLFASFQKLKMYISWITDFFYVIEMPCELQFIFEMCKTFIAYMSTCSKWSSHNWVF